MSAKSSQLCPAPSSGQDGGAAIVRHGSVIQFAHPVFGLYRDKALRPCKMLVCAALRELLGEPPLAHNGPSTLLATLHEQPAHTRLVPQGVDLPFEQQGDTLLFCVPLVDGYQVVEIGFGE